MGVDLHLTEKCFIMEKNSERCENMVCKNCGAWLADDAVVCTQCGAAPNAEAAQPETAEKPKKTYKMGWYKCNIYFSLWMSGFLYIINGFKSLAEDGDALINFIPEQSPIAVFYTIDSVRK